MNIAVTAGLSDKKLLSKLEPLLQNVKIDKIYLYRKTPLSHEKVINRLSGKVNSYLFFEIVRFFRLLIDSFRFKFDCYIGVYVFLHGIQAFIAGKFFRKPIIQLLPGSDVRYIVGKKRFVSILKSSDFLVTRGKITNSELIDLGINEDKLFVIPNLFNFSKIDSSTSNNEYRYDLVHVGNLIHRKRIDILLKSIHLVVTKYKMNYINLALVGDGPLEQNLKQLAFDLGIEKNVHFLGNQTNVNSYLKQSQIFIMTTEYEGQPQAMIEALAHGMPCIMPEVTNIPELAIHNYNSLIVKPLDVEGFSDAIFRIFTDEEFYLKLKNGAQKFRSEHEYEFSLDNVINKWSEIIDSITNKL